MRYLSTRGKVSGLTFEEALLSGYAADGGILLPEVFPSVSPHQMKQWSKLTFSQLVLEVTRLFIGQDEIPDNHLQELITKAFSRFTTPKIVKTARLSGDLNVLELFHGPTLAFKDLALSCLGQFYEYFLEKRKKHVTILVGTSGDTGSASIEAVRGLKWVDIVVLLPRGRTSRIQELQMTTVIADNVHVYRVDGTSDDLDAPIKECFRDLEFSRRHSLCSINSINWARIMVQIAHYYYSYFQLCPSCDGEVEIVVPTGAMGNVTGGVLAVEMGLPVKFTCAVNVNDIVARTIASGDFSASDSVVQTLAPAMDIQVPYNIERLLFIFTGGDADRVRSLMETFEQSKDQKMVIPADIHQKMVGVMHGVRVNDEGIKSAMRGVYESDQYLLCPHTATAVYYHRMQQEKGNNQIPRMCIATASPAKFEEAVTAAGLTPQPTDSVKQLDNMPTRYVDMEKSEDWDAILREKIEQIGKKAQNLLL